MAKIYKFYNDDQSINVEYVTDGLLNHETFHVTGIRGLDSIAIKAGVDFKELPYTETEFKAFAKTKNLNLVVYNDQTKVSTTLNAAHFLTYDFTGVTESAVTIGNGTILVNTPYGTTVTALVANFTLSSGATAAVGKTSQVSETTANDFTDPVVYVVTSPSGATKSWTVTVTVAADPLAAEKAAAALINEKSVEVPFGKGEDKAAVLAAIKALEAGNALIQALTEGGIEIADGKATVTFAEGVTAEVTVTVAA